jgi:hypothetical protein
VLPPGTGKATDGKTKKVELPGRKERLESAQGAAGLRVRFPDEKPRDVAASWNGHTIRKACQGGFQTSHRVNML